jgi:hypothetical protein
VGGGFRYFAGAVAFGFAAVWIMATLAGALVCLLSAAVAYGAVLVAERMRAKRAARGHAGRKAPSTSERPSQASALEDFPLSADALAGDLGYVYEPSPAMSAPTRAAEYGWVIDDDTAASTETLH